MPRLLILLTLPPDVTEQYRARLARTFPEIGIDVVADRRQGRGRVCRRPTCCSPSGR